MFSPRRTLLRKIVPALVGVTLFCAGARELRAVILFGTADPSVNTSAPTGALVNSGWQYEGKWGAFLGTVIGPHHFITAAHVGGSVGEQFWFRGVAYSTTAVFRDTPTDLQIWQVAETFPIYAPLYTSTNELGQPLIVIGRGTDRGGQVMTGRTARGWYWGAFNSTQRWGQNSVAEIVPYETTEFLYATFDRLQNGRLKPGTAAYNEAHLSSGDSGGAVFIKDAGIWKLAGINYAVDGPFYTSTADANGFNAALFDIRTFYEKDDAGNYTLVTGKSPVPSGFYATRISSRVPWITSVLNGAP